MKKIENYINKIKTKIDKKNDFYRYITIQNDFNLEKQDEIAQYILSKNDNAYINKKVLNNFQIPKEFKEKINIEKHIMKSHLNKYEKNELYKPTTKSKSNQTEKTICKRLWEQDHMYGKGEDVSKRNSKMNIIDFEVPVIYSKYNVENGKDTNNRCSGNGAVDLVAKAGKILYLIEAKDYKSKESLLRCIAEIRTYYEKIINHNEQDTKYISAKEMFKYSYGISKIVPAIMIFEGTQPYDDFLKVSEYKYLKKLASGITFFKIESKNHKKINTNTPVDKLKSYDFTFKIINIK